jgi:hypothetical protein
MATATGPLALALAAAVLGLPLSSDATLPCASDADCSLNGRCIVGNGECMCYNSWTGQACASLDLLPVPKPAAGPPGVSYGILPSANATGLATWGGSLIQDPQTRVYHLFASGTRGETDMAGVQGVHLNPLGLFPVCTSIPCNI